MSGLSGGGVLRPALDLEGLTHVSLVDASLLITPAANERIRIARAFVNASGVGCRGYLRVGGNQYLLDVHSHDGGSLAAEVENVTLPLGVNLFINHTAPLGRLLLWYRIL